MSKKNCTCCAKKPAVDPWEMVIDEVDANMLLGVLGEHLRNTPKFDATDDEQWENLKTARRLYDRVCKFLDGETGGPDMDG